MVTEQQDIPLTDTLPGADSSDSTSADGDRPLSPGDAPPASSEAQTDSEPPLQEPGSEPDYKALYKESEGKRKAAEQRTSSIDGNVRKQRDRDSTQDSILRYVRRQDAKIQLLEEAVLNPDQDLEALRQKQTQLTQKEAQTEATSKVVKRAERLRDRLGSKITRFGADLQDTRFSEGMRLWQQGADKSEIEDIEEAYAILDEALDTFRDEKAKDTRKVQEQEAVDDRRRNGQMSVDSGRGSVTSPSSSDQVIAQIADRASKGEMTKEDLKIAKKRGIIK